MDDFLAKLSAEASSTHGAMASEAKARLARMKEVTESARAHSYYLVTEEKKRKCAELTTMVLAWERPPSRICSGCTCPRSGAEAVTEAASSERQMSWSEQDSS